MEFVIAYIAVMATLVVYQTARRQHDEFRLRVRHLECLWRLEDAVDANLRGDVAYMFSALIAQEKDEVIR